MATKILKAIQDIAHDQLSVYSTIQNLIDTYHIYVDEIEDLEVTPFGANQFLISLIFLWLQQEWNVISFRLGAGLGRQYKTAKIKTAKIITKVIKTDLFGFSRNVDNISILLSTVKVKIAKYYRKIDAITYILAAILDYVFNDVDLQVVSLIIRKISMIISINYIRYIQVNTIQMTHNYRAWWNGVEVAQ